MSIPLNPKHTPVRVSQGSVLRQPPSVPVTRMGTNSRKREFSWPYQKLPAKRTVLSLLWASQERNTFLPSTPVMFASSLTTEPRVIGLGEGSGGEWLVAWSLRKVAGDDPTGVEATGVVLTSTPRAKMSGPLCLSPASCLFASASSYLG